MKRLEKLDLNLLLLLHWLLVERSVTRAGARLSLSQPAASRGLGRLRALFNDELLIRSGRTMTPSRLASSIAPQLGEIVSRLRSVIRTETDFDPGGFSQRVVIASNDYLATIGVRAWDSTIAERAPDAEASWRPLDASVVDALASGDVDLVLAPYAAQPNMPQAAMLQDMVVRPLLDDRFVVFGSVSHPIFKKQTMGAADFAAADHVLVSPAGSGPGLVDIELGKLGLTRKIRHRSWSFLHAADIALKTKSLAVVPLRLATSFAGAAHRRPPLKLVPLPSFIAWHASRTGDPAHRWIRREIIEALRDR